MLVLGWVGLSCFFRFYKIFLHYTTLTSGTVCSDTVYRYNSTHSWTVSCNVAVDLQYSCEISSDRHTVLRRILPPPQKIATWLEPFQHFQALRSLRRT